MRPLLVLLVALMADPAAAQLRTIPQNAVRAEIRPVQTNIVELNGRQMQLAPGAQIRDRSNRIIMPTALPPSTLVKYRLDDNGQVRDIWILTPKEAAQ